MRQNDAWLAVTRRALDASNANQLDTADLYARRSLRLSKSSPYPHYVMANVANARNQKTAAMGHWKMVLESAGSDTSYRDIKNSSLYYLAMSQLEAAQALKGDEQKAMAKDASASLKTLFSIQPDGADAGNVMGSWADAIKMAGEGDGSGAYADVLAKPTSYNDFTLTMAGVIAARANKSDDAMKLFEAATKKNPNSRDALNNLASAYYGKDQFLKMFDPTNKLVVIDPNNYDAWMFYAYASQGLAKGTKVPAEKKAWTDTLVKYQTKADALPVKAQISGFQHGATNASLSLSLEQVAATPGTYTVTVEFLDAAGAVVSTGTETVGPLKKGEAKAVTVKGTGANIQAYRYKPLK
jgi:predicted Zn-dependent protease